MSLFDALVGAADFLTNASKQVIDVAGAVADAKFGWQSRNLDLKLKNAELQNQANQIELTKAFQNAQLEIGKMQAKNAIQQAQQGFFGIDSLNADNINRALANVSARIAGTSGSNNTMLWLTVAGVGIAIATYFKKG